MVDAWKERVVCRRGFPGDGGGSRLGAWGILFWQQGQDTPDIHEMFFRGHYPATEKGNHGLAEQGQLGGIDYGGQARRGLRRARDEGGDLYRVYPVLPWCRRRIDKRNLYRDLFGL